MIRGRIRRIGKECAAFSGYEVFEYLDEEGQGALPTLLRKKFRRELERRSRSEQL